MASLAIHGGAAALVHRSISAASAVDDGEPARELHQVRRQQALDERRMRESLAELTRALDGARVDFTLIKGLTVATLYPEPGLRPFCDHDIVVSPGDAGQAREIAMTLPWISIDVHDHLPFFDGPGAADALHRRRRRPVAGVEVNVLAMEDALRLLALHALVHGVWRPVWLCDLAVVVEGPPSALDWDLVLQGAARQARAVTCALLLARDVLGARLDDTPLAGRTAPWWLEPALLARWGEAYVPRLPLQQLPRTPGPLLDELRQRFRDPITATAAVGTWDNLPRLPFQLLDLALRTARFLRRRT